MRILEGKKLSFDDVMIIPKRSEIASRSEVDLVRSFFTKHSNIELRGIPIFSSNMYATGSIALASSMLYHDCFAALCKHHDEKIVVDLISSCWNDSLFVTTGSTIDDCDKLNSIAKALGDIIPSICIDVANGYTSQFISFVKKTRANFPNSVIMAGNVCTSEATVELILAGADIVKVGIGSGGNCSTTNVTGVGYPQLSAVIECADAAHGVGGLICSDGGCKKPADIVKAIAAGTDFVMLGGMLAGTDECDGEWEYYINARDVPCKSSLRFFGMSSKEAMEQFGGWEKTYRASEGICTQVSYKGKVQDVLREIKGGLASACAYVGAARLKDLPKCATFIRVK